MQCGVPPWRELVKTRGIVGTPLLEISTRFVTAATYAEELSIATHVEEWRAKVFVQHHRVTRGETLICEGRETRAFVRRDADNPDRLRAIPIPDDIRALLMRMSPDSDMIHDASDRLTRRHHDEEFPTARHRARRRPRRDLRAARRSPTSRSASRSRSPARPRRSASRRKRASRSGRRRSRARSSTSSSSTTPPTRPRACRTRGSSSPRTTPT